MSLSPPDAEVEDTPLLCRQLCHLAGFLTASKRDALKKIFVLFSIREWKWYKPSSFIASQASICFVPTHQTYLKLPLFVRLKTQELDSCPVWRISTLRVMKIIGDLYKYVWIFCPFLKNFRCCRDHGRERHESVMRNHSFTNWLQNARGFLVFFRWSDVLYCSFSRWFTKFILPCCFRGERMIIAVCFRLAIRERWSVNFAGGALIEQVT